MSAAASSAGGEATGTGGTGADAVAATAAGGSSSSGSGQSVAVDGVTSAVSSAAETAQQVSIHQAEQHHDGWAYSSHGFFK